MRQIILLLGMVMWCQALLAQMNFTGDIGRRFPIVMQLDALNSDSTITGSYFYLRVGTPIKISGTYKVKSGTGGELRLFEKDPKGKETAEFILEVENFQSLRGEWKKLDDKQSLSVELESVLQLAQKAGLDNTQLQRLLSHKGYVIVPTYIPDGLQLKRATELDGDYTFFYETAKEGGANFIFALGTEGLGSGPSLLEEYNASDNKKGKAGTLKAQNPLFSELRMEYISIGKQHQTEVGWTGLKQVPKNAPFAQWRFSATDIAPAECLKILESLRLLKAADLKK